ncbi:hypothetical protein GIW81_09940 [Hyphomicrobium sp. xq]|uniref:O-Antigen ligase n=1 Tax=Hyphomicrobium album TaxID=2665159 RepID=A0A6I3KL39_9HYPH|nr:hypothetical protein [Hyphomicrobium album]MTD94650.1 hypothetical protein [Hyphomicrobium album]
MIVLRSLAVAISISASAIVVIIFGALGITSNPLLTAVVLAAPLAFLVATSPRVKLVPADFVFAAFVGLAMVSIAVNGMTASGKAFVLFLLSLAAYPAFRGIRREFDLVTFVATTGAVVAIGTIATALAIGPQDVLSHPAVFGFEEAAIYFSISFGLLVLAFVSSGTSAVALFTLAIPCIVYAAAMVRHPIIALLAGLASMLSVPGRRVWAVAAIATIVVAYALGSLIHPEKSQRLIRYAVSSISTGASPEKLKLDPQASVSPHAPACGAINWRNSIALRMVLTREAIEMIPHVGPVGSGLNSFATASCMKMYPHNIFLQAAVELGATATVLLVVLLMLALRAAFLAGDSFVLAGLVFACVEAIFSGALTGAILPFAFIGWAAGLPGRAAGAARNTI